MSTQVGYLCVWEKCISFRCKFCHEYRQRDERDRCVPFPVYATPELLQGFRLKCARCWGANIGTGTLRIELLEYANMWEDPLLVKLIPIFERIWSQKYGR